jgi:uncharacterized OsmC-like protein
MCAMSTSATAEPEPSAPTTPSAPELWVDRTGTRTGTGRNDRGATVAIGPRGTEGVFSPGELMAIALAGCSLMSADAPIARRLGPDVAVTAVVERETSQEENRDTHARVELRLDLATLDDEARAALASIVDRSVAKACTVGRTLDAGLPHDVVVVHDGQAG